jgi:hypothetical protein
MNTRTRRLIALNAALLAALAIATIAGTASAQPGGAGAALGRARGDYTLISGRYQGGTAGAVYVLDASNQDILALTWDRTRDRFNIVGHRSLIEDSRVQKQAR